MKFRTEIPLCDFSFDFYFQDQVLFLGSCFATSISSRLQQDGFAPIVNPTGIIFNPVSIAQSLNILNSGKWIDEHFVEQVGVTKHLDFHSSLHGESLPKLEELFTQKCQEWQAYSSSIKVVFVTLGTSWVYKYNITDQIVTNCHKLPAHAFTKSILSVSDIIRSLGVIRQYFKDQVKLVFTISPIRHIKDGMVENQRSKSSLITAVHQFVEMQDNAFYFPSYEILMDELRDYRFYAKDMIHPSEFAIDIIYQRFLDTFTTRRTEDIIKKWRKVRAFLKHKPLNVGSKKGLETEKRKKLNEFKTSYPEVNTTLVL